MPDFAWLPPGGSCGGPKSSQCTGGSGETKMNTFQFANAQ